MRIQVTIWLLPLAFLLHDGEEIATMPAWLANNRATLDRIADLGEVASRVVSNLPVTTREVSIAVVFELVLILIATGALAVRVQRGFTLYFYSAVLGAFLVHVLTHVGQAVIFGGYTPGVASAVLVVPPASLYLYRSLFRVGLLTPRTAVLSGVAGALVVLPVVVVAHRVGRIFA